MIPQYFAAIGKSDHIKHNGQRLPYWELLDVQPDGWLNAIPYFRDDLPRNCRRIFDCGAWTYRNKRLPEFNGKYVTPKYALKRYLENAQRGDILVAPDHMLIGDNLDIPLRREFNRRSAAQFIELCPTRHGFQLMATVHGIDVDERLENCQRFYEMGYNTIAIGGIAGKSHAKDENVYLVETIRNEFPDLRLHVFGLSSPNYVEEWYRIGVNSFDGSSHYKQAFTGGKFYVESFGDLVVHKAAKTERGNRHAVLEPITAPLCDCRVCSSLRDDGIDTRTYGSNENNMGRAAHNQGMLIRAHRWRTNQVLFLVSCVGKKMPESARAKDLYTSTWFKKAKRFVESTGKLWGILSAEYGLVWPDTVIAPYEKTLNEMRLDARREWAYNVFCELCKLRPGVRIIFLAGDRYRNPLSSWLARQGYIVEAPLQGLGIGLQLKWFDENTPRFARF